MSQPQSPTPDTQPPSATTTAPPSATTPSISAAAQMYQLAMQSQQAALATSGTPRSGSLSSGAGGSGVLQMPGATRDVVMEDAPHHRGVSPATTHLSTPIPPPSTHARSHSPILPPQIIAQQASLAQQAQAQLAQTQLAHSTSPIPVPPPRISTPKPNGAGAATNTPISATAATAANDQSSRATSQHPEVGLVMPSEASAHGGSARTYLNGAVTGVLLEGMKLIAKDQPKDPLRVLGEFLLAKSKELEAGNGN